MLPNNYQVVVYCSGVQAFLTSNVTFYCPSIQLLSYQLIFYVSQCNCSDDFSMCDYYL